MGYDFAGNLSWSASGLPPSTGCSISGTETAILARKATRTYDTRNRLTSLSFPDGNGDQTWTYTPDGLPDQVVTYNDGGNTWTTNAYAYNKRRLLAGESQAENDRDPSWTWAIGYGYNANGHLATQSYPANLIVDFAPNALGQATKATSATHNFVTGVSYFPNGALKQFTYGNGIVHTLTQNARGLPDRSLDAYGATKFLDDGYDYDPNGNVAAISDGATATSPHGDRTMTHDGLDRLTTARSPMWSDLDADYTYDALDNLIQVLVPTAGIYPGRNHHYCYDGTNRLATVKTVSCTTGGLVLTVDYDVQGNLDTWNALDYDFDFGNRLREVSTSAGTPIESYRYDGHGRRIRNTNAAGTLYSLYGRDGQLFWSRDERDQQRRQFVYLAGSLVAEHTRPIGASTETVTYQHTDALGSPTVRTSQARVELDRLEYEPYGKRIDAANDDLPGFTGHVMDSATGLTYMQQRYYDPRVGRFWSVDPVTANGHTGNNFNRYKYAGNNPYRFTDPDGRREKPIGSNIRGGGGFAGSNVSVAVGPPSVRAGDNAVRNSGNTGGSGWGAAAVTAATVARPAASTGAAGGISGVGGLGAFIRGLLGRAVITAPFVIGGDSRQPDMYLHYGYAVDAENFAGGLRPGGYATLPGLGYTGEQAQQMLALPHHLPPDSFYVVKVSSGIPFIGPLSVQPTIVPPRTGGGIEFIFPQGTPPGSVTGPYPLGD